MIQENVGSSLQNQSGNDFYVKLILFSWKCSHGTFLMFLTFYSNDWRTMEPVKSGKKRCSSSRSDDFSNQLIIKDHVRRTQFTVNWMVSKEIVVEFPVKGSFDWKLSCNMLNNSFFNCLDRLSYIRVNHQSTDCHCWNSFSRESSKSGLILWHNVESTS